MMDGVEGHPRVPGGTVSESTTTAPADPNTGAGLIEFLDAAIDKGWFNVGSARALKTATLKVFEVENGWASMDLRSLDAESLFERFRNLKRNSYSDDSIRVYKTRFTQALKMHLARLDGDTNWKTYGPSARSNSSPKVSTTGSKATQMASGKTRQNPGIPSESPSSAPTTPEAEESTMTSTPSSGPGPLMRFPYPLRDNVDVWLTLPRDLTKEEAERLSIFIGSLARPDAATPAGSTAK
jgi:hypothetical protein